MRKLILTTGGTGGHIFPALAVAHELERIQPDTEILFVGSVYGPEKELVEDAGLAFHGFKVRGLLGRGLRSFGAAFNMVGAFFGAVSLLHAFKPNVVVGFGGYASFATLLAAVFLRIPCVLHEQNAYPGMSNRFMGRFAKRICISMPQTSGFPQKKCIFTGNPVRESVIQAGLSARSYTTRHLLVLGGSQGAHALNSFICAHLDTFLNAGIEIIHQTGKNDFDTVAESYEAHGYSRSCVRAFIDDMPSVYQWADLALCRSGASTIAELCACGLPSILVPFPYAIHDHQTKNAMVLEDAQAAKLVAESTLKHAQGADSLVSMIVELFDNPQDRAQMSHNVKSIARPDAAAKVAQAILQLT